MDLNHHNQQKRNNKNLNHKQQKVKTQYLYKENNIKQRSTKRVFIIYKTRKSDIIKQIENTKILKRKKKNILNNENVIS